MDRPNSGSGDLPEEPDAPTGAEGDLDVSALDALLADVGTRRRRRPTPRARTAGLDDALLAPALGDLPPPPAGSGSTGDSAATSTGDSAATAAASTTVVRRRRSSSSARPPLWRTIWPGGTAPNAERALPPPPMRRAARIERRFVWSMAFLAGLASAGSAVHPTGVGLPDVLLRFGFAFVVTLAAGRARRSTWIVLAGAAAVLNPGGIWMASALVALAVALVATVVDRRKYLGAVVALFAVPALLRADTFGFTGLSAICVWAAVIPVLVSGYRVASRRSRERMQQVAMVVFLVALGGTLLFALAVVLSWGDLRSGSDRAERGLESLRSGQGPEAAVELSDAADALGSAHGTLSAWWVAPARLVPFVAQQAEAMTALTGEGRSIAATGSSAASKADYRRLRYEGGRIDIERLRALQQPLADTSDALDAASDRFDDVSSPWLVGPVADQLAKVSDEVDRIAPQAELASAGADVAPALLGGDGTRHYFVAFTTEAEARGLNGFMGNWAELTAEDGKLTLSRSGRVAELNEAPGGDERVVTEPADYAENYQRFKVGTHLQDVTVSPDLPSVATAIGQLYPQMGGEPVDGVIVVDPYGLAALLEFTGPIQVDGSPETLTADNAAEILVRRQYVEFDTRAGRADFLDQASRKTFEKLTTGDIPGPERIGAVLGPAVADKHLMFSVARPDEQDFMQDLGASGAFPQAQPDRDFFAVTSQNSANNKIDVFLHRSVTYDSTYDPGTGRITSKATVTLHNDAPSSGLPDSVIGSNDRGLPPGTNRLLLSFYSPLDLVDSTIDGAHQGFESQLELGYRVYRRYIGIPPGGTVTVQLDLAGTIDARSDYKLAVGVQPMVNQDRIEAVVHPTEGWLAEDATVLHPDVDGGRASFLIQPGHDISASTTFRPR